jgi:DNA-binding transcriptional regulator YdaS (Cro superfamily)
MVRAMNHTDIIQHFGSQAEAARRLKLRPQVLQMWKRRRKIPRSWQFAIEVLTSGALKSD